jgi:hypothetical protein
MRGSKLLQNLTKLAAGSQRGFFALAEPGSLLAMHHHPLREAFLRLQVNNSDVFNNVLLINHRSKRMNLTPSNSQNHIPDT